MLLEYVHGTSYKYIFNTIPAKNDIKYTLSSRYDGKELSFFENNNKTSKMAEGTIKKPNGNTIMVLGANSSEDKAVSEYFNGTIYSVRIYNRALTDEEVKNNYFIDQIRYNVALEKDEEGYVHYTAEELKQMGFTEIEQDAWINWDTREVKMEYEGQKYSSEKFNAQSNIEDVKGNTNFDLDIKYEDNRYKVTVAPEENAKNMQVSYRVKAEAGQAENEWIIVNGFKFELGTYNTYEVKLSDGKGNQTIKTIKQTLEKVTSNGEIAYLDGTLGEPLVNYKIYGKSVQNGTPSPENPVEIKSLGQTGSFNILVTGKNILKGLSTPKEDKNYWYMLASSSVIAQSNGWAHIIRDNSAGETNSGWIQLFVQKSYKKMFKENQDYTLCYELKNIKENGGDLNLTTNHGNAIGSNDDIFRKTIGNTSIKNLEENKIYSITAKTSSGDEFKNSSVCLRTHAGAYARQKVDYEMRFWIYEGEQTENLEYEPYDETIQKVAVSEPLRSLPINSKDEIVYREGIMSTNIGRYTYNGSEIWEEYERTKEDLTTWYNIKNSGTISPKSNGTNLLSTHFKTGFFPEGNVVRYGDPNMFFSISRNIANTISEMRQWLSKNNVEVLYELKESKQKTINLPKIDTKKGATHILIEDETVGQTGGEYTYIKTEILD